MEEGNQQVREALEDAINRYVRGRADSQQLEAIIWTNFHHDRVHNYLDLGDEQGSAGYVQRVVHNYEHHHQFVECVQTGNEKIWLELYPKMQHWAYRYLLKRGFYPGSGAFDLAVSYAGDAGGIVVNAHYPYDVEIFDAWAYQILLNVCRRNMRQAISQDQIPDRQLVSLDTPELSEFSTATLDYLVERSLDLEKAFAQLTPREQQILLWLLNGRSTEEIAAKLDITANNVYHAKHIIIKKLRKILGTDSDNDE